MSVFANSTMFTQVLLIFMQRLKNVIYKFGAMSDKSTVDFFKKKGHGTPLLPME